MELRLAHQVRALDRGASPGNDIDPGALTHLEETLLKQAFTQISNIQKKISFDFPKGRLRQGGFLPCEKLYWIPRMTPAWERPSFFDSSVISGLK